MVPTPTAVDLTSNGNTYSGGTTISNSGYLLVSNPSNAGFGDGLLARSPSITAASWNSACQPDPRRGQSQEALTNNGTIAFNLTNQYYFGNSVSGTGTVVDNQAGTIFFTTAGTKTYTGTTLINSGALIADQVAGAFPTGSLFSIASGGTLQVNNNESIFGLSGAGALSLNNSAATLTTTNTSTQTYTGSITGSGTLALTGTGSTILGGSSTYSGTTTVSGGTLIVTNTAGTSATGTSALSVSSGATLEFGLSTGSASGAVSGAITNNGGLVFDLTNATSFANVVSGTGTLTQNKASVLTFTGAAGNLTYTGSTIITAGTISDQVDENNAFSPTSLDGRQNRGHARCEQL